MESVEPRRNQFGWPKTHQHQREDALPGFLAHGDCGTRLRRWSIRARRWFSIAIERGGAQGGDREKSPHKKANLSFSTHYTDYDSAPTAVEGSANRTAAGKKGRGLASQSGILGFERSSGNPGGRRRENILAKPLRARKPSLSRQRAPTRSHPKSNNVVQPARTAAQIAENARALALGVVGGNLIRQLEDELARARAELEETRAELSKANAKSSEDPKTSGAGAQASEPQAESGSLAQLSPASRLAKLSSARGLFGLHRLGPGSLTFGLRFRGLRTRTRGLGIL